MRSKTAWKGWKKRDKPWIFHAGKYGLLYFQEPDEPLWLSAFADSIFLKQKRSESSNWVPWKIEPLRVAKATRVCGESSHWLESSHLWCKSVVICQPAVLKTTVQATDTEFMCHSFGWFTVGITLSVDLSYTGARLITPHGFALNHNMHRLSLIYWNHICIERRMH